MGNEYRSYWVCATTRSGSSLLCESLRNTGLAGNPEEFFHKDDEPGWFEHFGVTTFEEYLPALFAQTSTPNGVFGTKATMGGGYFRHLVKNLQTLPQAGEEMSVPELVQAAFPDLRYIWIARRNKVQQAVSWWKAIQTNRWAQTRADSPPAGQELEFKFEAIDHLVQEIVRREASWQEYFTACGVTPYVVVYEDFVGTYEDTARAILGFLAIPVPNDLVFGERRLQKQADSLSEEWVQRYRDLKQADWTASQWEFMPDDG